MAGWAEVINYQTEILDKCHLISWYFQWFKDCVLCKNPGTPSLLVLADCDESDDKSIVTRNKCYPNHVMPGDCLMKHHRWVTETSGWKPQGLCSSFSCASGRSCPLRHLFIHLHAVVSTSTWDVQHIPKCDPHLTSTSHTSEGVLLQFPQTWGTYIFKCRGGKAHTATSHFPLAISRPQQVWSMLLFLPTGSHPWEQGEDYSAGLVLKFFITFTASSRDPMD